jgi:uncharacterized protein
LINPFITDRPQAPEELIDRDSEAETLLNLALGGHNARLSAPRRYGKTTLLGKVLQDARAVDLTTVYVDFYGVVSLAEVIVRIEEAYRTALQGPVAQWFAGVRRTWSPAVRAGGPAVSIEVELRPEAEGLRLLQQLLDLPLGVYERTARRTLVVFDEFQALLAAGNRIDGLIRSRIQQQREQASYIFAGSHPGLMAELFGDQARPLYGQARALRLGPLDDTSLAAYIGARFEETERGPGKALDPLLEAARGHPQRAMLLAHHLWEVTRPGETADEASWAQALAAAFSELQEAFERTWETLTPNQRRVLAAVAWIGRWGGGVSFYGADTLARFRLTRGTARDVRHALVRRGDLEEDGGAVRTVDPLLEAWIASGRRPLY